MATNTYNKSLINTSKIIMSKEKLLILILILYFSDFMDLGDYIPFLLIPVAFIYVLNNKIHANLLMLILFCAVYSSFLYYYSFMTNQAILLRLLTPPTLYAIGYYLVKKRSSFEFSYKLITAMILSFSIYGILCIIYTAYLYGSIANSTAIIGRVVKIVWTGKVIAATGLNTYLSMGFILLPLVFVRDKLIKNKFLLFIVFILCLYSTVVIGNRTGLIAIIATLLTVYLFSTPFNSKKIVYSLAGVSLSFLFYQLYISSVFSNLRYLIGNTLVFRSSASEYLEDPRLLAWKLAFYGMFKNPVGGKLTYLPMHTAHNVWLDVAYEGGIFPFLLILIFTIFSLLSIARFSRSDAPTVLKVLFIGLTTCFMLIFFAEPILLGWMSCFNAFCFLIGIVQSLNVMMKNKVL